MIPSLDLHIFRVIKINLNFDHSGLKTAYFILTPTSSRAWKDQKSRYNYRYVRITEIQYNLYFDKYSCSDAI